MVKKKKVTIKGINCFEAKNSHNKYIIQRLRVSDSHEDG